MKIAIKDFSGRLMAYGWWAGFSFNQQCYCHFTVVLLPCYCCVTAMLQALFRKKHFFNLKFKKNHSVCRLSV